MQIETVEQVTLDLVEALQRLLPQLSSSAPILNADDLDEIVRGPGTALLVARDPSREGRIVGTATVVIFRIPSGLRARLESVVVEESARNQGVGEALCRAGIRKAVAAGVSALDLSSHSTRLSANKLYERLGFEKRTTNVYRMEFPQGMKAGPL